MIIILNMMADHQCNGVVTEFTPNRCWTVYCWLCSV